jgi:hypothetical protein
MAPAASWTNLAASDFIPLGAALLLLQKTFVDGQYRDLTVPILQDKMLAHEPNSSADATRLLLYVWSFGAVDDPDVSAFFFLRRRHKASNPQERFAYCMTVAQSHLLRRVA